MTMVNWGWTALQLRDHLALSATSRFFRSCYTDLVWEVRGREKGLCDDGHCLC